MTEKTYFIVANAFFCGLAVFRARLALCALFVERIDASAAALHLALQDTRIIPFGCGPIK
jgi:hypothetical protein